MARGSFRFLVSGEMKKYPRNEQLKPMQLSVHETSDNKSPLSLGRICNWFLPRRNYPFNSSLMRILDYEILLLNWLRNENSVRFRRRWIVRVLINFLLFPFQHFFYFFPLLVSRLYVACVVALRSKFIKPIHARVRFFFLSWKKKKNSRCSNYFYVKNKLLIFIFNRKTFFSEKGKSFSLMKKEKKKEIFEFASMARFDR